MARSTFTIEWEAPEHEHKERSGDWFWSVGILSVSVAITAAILDNFIFGLVVLIGAFALCLFVNREPDSIRVIVSEKGIAKNNIYYPYHTLQSFWIDVEHPHKKMILRSQKPLMPFIVIPIGDSVDIEKLHETLSLLLPEEYHKLPLVEQLLEYLGF